MVDDVDVVTLSSEELQRWCASRAIEKFGAGAALHVYPRSSFIVAQVTSPGDCVHLKALGTSPHAALESLWRKLR